MFQQEFLYGRNLLSLKEKHSKQGDFLASWHLSYSVIVLNILKVTKFVVDLCFCLFERDRQTQTMTEVEVELSFPPALPRVATVAGTEEGSSQLPGIVSAF